MKNLMSMTDYIIQQHEQCISSTWRTYNYAKFLEQPLELWMFVPCDEDGNVLEEPEFHEPNNENEIGDYDELRYKYQQAKERCLFEGFKVQNTKEWINYYGGMRVYNVPNDLEKYASIVFRETEIMNKTIEDLTKYDLQLTQTAIKKLGL